VEDPLTEIARDGARRSKSLDALLPVLYLRGISTGDFQKALAAVLGTDAPNLPPNVISRLTGEWQKEYDRWQRRDLSARGHVYIRADGVYPQVRMEARAECMLVIPGFGGLTRPHRRPRSRLTLGLNNQPHRALAHLREKLVRSLAHDAPSLRSGSLRQTGRGSYLAPITDRSMNPEKIILEDGRSPASDTGDAKMVRITAGHLVRPAGRHVKSALTQACQLPKA
jgi:hypothetical protein